MRFESKARYEQWLEEWFADLDAWIRCAMRNTRNRDFYLQVIGRSLVQLQRELCQIEIETYGPEGLLEMTAEEHENFLNIFNDEEEEEEISSES